MTKVKLIHPAWLSAPNGANTVMNALLQSKELFSQNGIEISSLSYDTFSPRSFDKVSQKSTKAIWRLKLKKWLKDSTKYSRIACDVMIYLTQIRPAKRIVKIYLESTPDCDEIVFFHTMMPCYYFLKHNNHRQHTVVVLHTNGEDFKMEKIYFPMLCKSLVYKKMQKMGDYMMKNVDRINFVSESSMSKFLKEHPEVNPDKVSYIYNGIKDGIINTHSKGKRDVIEFCCVASISKRKGQHYIIKALKMFSHQDVPNVHFSFVGDGSDRKLLEMEVEQAGLEKYVSFVGISQSVDDYLDKSDVFILPSEDEGLPMAIIEAMRASLPIVSTPVGGIPEMVEDGNNGLLIEPTAMSVYNLLCKVESYDWHIMGLNARKTFEKKFSIQKMVSGYVKLMKF